MLIKIFFAIIALVILVYFLSRIQMKAWIHEIDNKINNYLPKKNDDIKG
jgi:uncharacterized membrane protein